MADQSSQGYSTVWPNYYPGRGDFAAIIEHRLLLVAGILIAILSVWGSATSPRSAGFGTDITTAIPDYVVDDSAQGGESTANYPARNRP